MGQKSKTRKIFRRSKKNHKKSRALRGGKLLGYGGNGCAFSPSLSVNFPESIINNENKDLYVSKIGHGVEEEFYISNSIKTKLSEIYPGFEVTPGWFPDELICTNLDEKGKIPNLSENDIEEAIKYSTCKQSFSQAKKENGVCILNSKKFDMTLDDYYKSIKIYEIPYDDMPIKIADELEELRDLAQAKLNALHAADIFHLDIKPPNFALVTSMGPKRIYYFDWDLANYNDKYLNYRVEFILTNSNYYFVTIPQKLIKQNEFNGDFIKRHVLRRLKRSGTTIQDMKATLESVDNLMFISSFWFLYKSKTLDQIYKLLDDVIIRT